MQHIVGLLGYPLTHSFSPNYFNNKWAQTNQTNWQYQTYQYQNIIDAVHFLKQVPHLVGFNITIPHKQNIVPYLHSLAACAKAIGAVNCVHIINNKWVGFNTDYLGFKNSFQQLLNPSIPLGKALILGNGGAAKAVKYSLQILGISYTIVERNPKINSIAFTAVNANVLQQYQYIINTTPLGTFPNINHAPALPYHAINSNHIAYDLVYNPAETLFLKNCKTQGAIIKNGSDMLAIQADESWKIWNNLQVL